jgi:hypothetical protein
MFSTAVQRWKSLLLPTLVLTTLTDPQAQIQIRIPVTAFISQT